MNRCAGCGYFAELHDVAGKCPLCPCGEVPAEHVPEDEGKMRCPGKATYLRRGSFREAPAAQFERRPGWGDVLFPAVQRISASDPYEHPQVPARLARGPGEVAPAAFKAGRLAAESGWVVDPWYWRDAYGGETSVLVMQLGDRRAAAYWRRVPGDVRWLTAGAHAWLRGSFPAKLGITALKEALREAVS